LGWRKREIFLQAGLDRANQLEPLQQIRFLAQRLFADFTMQGSENLFVRGLNERSLICPSGKISSHSHRSFRGASEASEPGIQGFPDAQLRI
jgi:hypothetical protein